jgi:hypothetical protein
MRRVLNRDAFHAGEDRGEESMNTNGTAKVEPGERSQERNRESPHRPHVRANRANEAGQNQAQNPPEDPARERIRVRMAHVLRGFILMFALGMPRMFYYLFGIYGVFVLSGAVDKLQSAEFRQFLTGSRPPLDVQLARLRQRAEMLEKLRQIEHAIEFDEDFDSDELRRINEFLSTFEAPLQPTWTLRFIYQLIFLFIYSALPTCHPHQEYLK